MSNDRTDGIDRIVDRLEASLRPDWQACIYGAVETLDELCESPIEVMLGSAIMLGALLSDGANKAGRSFYRIQSQSSLDLSAAVVIVVPQYQWEGYRIDFAILSEYLDRPVFIECDGHDFHERTKEQASRDRSKDRKIQEAGMAVLRFTGSEIYRDPGHCAVQITNVVGSRVRPRK